MDEKKLNCWEHLRCGRTDCPAKTEERLDGIHEGTNAGRACWVVAGTRCGGIIQGSFAKKIGSCMKCEFYLLVRQEQAGNMKNGAVLVAMLNNR